MKTIKLGLIGFGTVGSGVLKILAQIQPVIEKKLGVSLKLVKIADLDIKTDRGVPIAPNILTKDSDEILNHPEIDIVIELIGGLEPARTFVLKAISNGKHVVTANKALLAKYADELFSASDEKNVGIGYEASVAGCIPIIRSIRESFVATNINSIMGIVNGTANFILSKMTEDGSDFDDVLKEAQEKGYAEADPTFDIEGIDSAHKIAILTRLVYGTPVNFDEVYIQGIAKITQEDIQCAHEFGYRIKLLAISKIDGDSLEVRVHPAMIPVRHSLSSVDGVLNAVRVEDEIMGEAILTGHGAGSLPTASAVLGDVAEMARNIISGTSTNRVPPQSFLKSGQRLLVIKSINEIESEYFLRFNVNDKPGVLSIISGILGHHAIGIKSVIQRGRDLDGRGVSLILMTHMANEKNVQDALLKIDQQEVVCKESIFIRCEK
tara:strand:+ start:190 stop:1497 length:1308 start_codon:yes stop_codon:yes gene_type:complete